MEDFTQPNERCEVEKNMIEKRSDASAAQPRRGLQRTLRSFALDQYSRASDFLFGLEPSNGVESYEMFFGFKFDIVAGASNKSLQAPRDTVVALRGEIAAGA